MQNQPKKVKRANNSTKENKQQKFTKDDFTKALKKVSKPKS